jgi:hypothetical protein
VSASERAALEHERSLEALLERLGEPAGSADALEAAARRCTETFEALRSAGAPNQEALERAQTRTRLALDLANRELEEVVRRLRQAREVRRALSAPPVPRAGNSCDVEG